MAKIPPYEEMQNLMEDFEKVILEKSSQAQNGDYSGFTA